MFKRLLLLLILAWALPAVQLVSARQSQDLSFRIETITLKGLPAYDLKVSPDGRFAAAYIGQTAAVLLNISVMEYVPDVAALPIHLIDLTTGTEMGLLTGPTDYASDVAFTPDGKQMVSYHRNGDLFLWDVTTQSLVKRLTSLLGGNGRVEFLPDNKTLLVSLQLGFISNFLTWDMETGSITKIWHKALASYGEMKSMLPDSYDALYVASDLSPDGSLLAVASGVGEVALWDTTTLEQTVLQRAPEDPDQKMKAVISILTIAFSSDGTRLVYFDMLTRQTHWWDVASRTEIYTLDLGDRSWGISPNGDALVWVVDRSELWFAYVDQPEAAVKVMDFPDNLMVGRSTLTFTADNEIIVGGFSNPDGGDNPIYIVKFK